MLQWHITIWGTWFTNKSVLTWHMCPWRTILWTFVLKAYQDRNLCSFVSQFCERDEWIVCLGHSTLSCFSLMWFSGFNETIDPDMLSCMILLYFGARWDGVLTFVHPTPAYYIILVLVLCMMTTWGHAMETCVWHISIFRGVCSHEQGEKPSVAQSYRWMHMLTVYNH